MTFEPGARTTWPDRPDANVVSGVGRVQISGGPVRPGDTVWTPPGEKHWSRRPADHRHGPLAMQEALDGKQIDRLEHVTQVLYRAESG